MRLVVVNSANIYSNYRVKTTNFDLLSFFWHLSNNLMNAIILKNVYNRLQTAGIGL